jgi:hypothetical protein
MPDDDKLLKGGVVGRFLRQVLDPRLVVLVLCFALFAVGVWAFFNWHVPARIAGSFEKLPISESALYSVLWALAGGVLVIGLAITLIPDIDEMRLALMLAIFGSSLGWIIGTYVSPQDVPEQQAFAGFKTAVVGVLSGWLLSKLQVAFSKLLDNGQLLTRQFAQRSMFLMIPMLVTISAVYNVREYKNLTVFISTSDKTTAIDRNSHIELHPGDEPKFLAEARFTGDTSVTWSIDPPERPDPKDATKRINLGKINADGSWKVPAEFTGDCIECFEVVAQSNKDKSKTGRRTVDIKKEPPPEKPSDSHTKGQKATKK